MLFYQKTIYVKNQNSFLMSIFVANVFHVCKMNINEYIMFSRLTLYIIN